MSKNEIIIDQFKGLATTRNKIPSTFLHDMENFSISEDSGQLERRGGTKVFDIEDNFGYFNLFNTTISGVEIVIGIRFDNLKLYAWLKSRPQTTLQLRDVSPKATFKTQGGILTNELCFTSGTKFKIVESQNSIMLWSNGVSEIIIIQKNGILKIAESLSYYNLTTINDMLNSGNEECIYVNAIKLEYDETLIAYFAESRWNTPFSSKNAYITTYSDIGTIGVSSEVIRRSETDKLGGYISPFKIETVDIVLRGALVNTESWTENSKYIYKSGAGVEILDSWDPSRPNYDIDLDYTLLYIHEVLDIADYVLPPAWTRTFVLKAVTRIQDSSVPSDDQYPEYIISNYDKYPIKVKYSEYINGLKSSDKYGWIEIDAEYTSQKTTGTVTTTVTWYKISSTNIPLPTKMFVKYMNDAGDQPNLALGPLVRQYMGGYGPGDYTSSCVLQLHGNTGTYSEPPASALVINDSYFFNGQSIVSIKEGRFKHDIRVFPTGLNTSSLTNTGYINVKEQKLILDIDSDILLDNTEGQVEYFMSNGSRLSLFDTVDVNQILSKTGVSTNISGVITYDVDSIPVGHVGSQDKIAPLNTCKLTNYYAPFISTRYSNVTSRYMTAETNLPLDLRSVSDISVVPPFVFAVKDNYILRGDSNTLTLNDSIEVGNSPKFIERCGDSIIVFYSIGASSIKINKNLQVASFMDSEKLEAKFVHSNNESVIVVNADGTIYLVGYTYSNITDDGNVTTKYINARNISTGVMNESDFIDIVDITYVNNTYYLANKTEVYLYNTRTKQWSGRYKFTDGREILSISHLNGELLINNKGIDDSLADLFSSNSSGG